MEKIMLENIVQTEKESAEFEKYKAIKGEYLYKQVSDILFELDGKPVSYSDVSSIIRYDKNLRDTLFIYLATFEESLRAELFRKYDVGSADYVYRYLKGCKKLKNDIRSKNSSESSNLYFCFELELGPMIELLDHLGLYSSETISGFKEIKDLRNHVMHHNVLTLGRAKNISDFRDNFALLQRQICMLKDNLPTEYQLGFIGDINKLPCKRKEFKIILEK